MSKRKDKKAIAKKSAKAQQRKKQKRKLRLVKTKQQHLAPQSVPPYFDQPPMAEVYAPPGFRAVSMSQAVMEFSKAIINWDEPASPDAMNKMFQFATLLWNYGIVGEQEKIDHESKKEILKMIEVIYEADSDKAQALLGKFVARKNELFPPEIQPKGSPMMFMRKEMNHLVAPFNYKQLDLGDELFPVDDDDEDFLDQLHELDQNILDGMDYEDWEEKYLALEESCRKSFSGWLEKKGAKKKFIQDFPFMATVFTNFIYRYGHSDVGILRGVRPDYFEEFFFDHVLRKVMMDPHEHVEWPPVLKLFFQFLSEKGYLDDAGQHIMIIDALERQFIDVLRERYG